MAVYHSDHSGRKRKLPLGIFVHSLLGPRPPPPPPQPPVRRIPELHCTCSTDVRGSQKKKPPSQPQHMAKHQLHREGRSSKPASQSPHPPLGNY